MKRRDFLAASAAALACTARLVADEKAAEKPREPDFHFREYSGAIAVSPDSKVLTVAHGPVADKRGVCFLNPETGTRLPDFEQTTGQGPWGDSWAASLGFSPDGKYLAAGSDGFVALWDVATGRRLKNIEPESRKTWGVITEVNFAPDSKYIIVPGGLWPVNGDGNVRRTDKLAGYDRLAISTKGGLVATRRGSVIKLWKYLSFDKQTEIETGQENEGTLMFTPDGTHILSMPLRGTRRTYYLWDTMTGERKEVSLERSLARFAFSPDSSLIATTAREGIAVLAFDGGQLVQLLAARQEHNEDTNYDVEFVPNQRVLAFSRVSGLRIWKEANGFKA